MTHPTPTPRRLPAPFLALVLAALACSALTCAPPASSLPPTPAPTVSARAPATAAPSPTPAATATPARAVRVSRIAIRTVGGQAEFFDTVTGQRFVPRGVNYVDFYPSGRGTYEDRAMATNVYDPNRVRAAFQTLAAHGYNTVRAFFDNCGFGPYCIGKPGGLGLNPAYLDNMVDLLYIAGEEGLHVIYTANSVPEEGGYWQYFDEQINVLDKRYGFESFENADWLHPAGVEIKRRFWTDLMEGMTARSAPFEVVLGWQLTNELWLFKNAPPLSLNEGLVTISNEQSYDMADPAQKRQMVVDGVLHYMRAIVPIIKAHDPQALTTIGFFAPQFPHPTGIGGDWYVDTAPLLPDAPVDFWDFHAYYDTDLSVQQQAENFGLPGYTAKPVVMGETGSGHANFPSAYTGLTVGTQWIAGSCPLGFQGWLNWGYFPWPEDLSGSPWTFLDQGEVLLRGFSPARQPDPCAPLALEAPDVALGRPVSFSNQTPDYPAANAVDGQNRPWSAADYPPQWVQVTLDGPTTVQRVGMTVDQWPPGRTHHQVWATLVNGQAVLLADFYGFTTVEMSLGYDLPLPLGDVVAVRFLTLESPSWVAWKEVEVIASPSPAAGACLGTASTTTALYRWPGAGQPQVSELTTGRVAYLDGRHLDASGARWWRVGAGTWAPESALALEGGCESPALVGAPLPQSVPVTFSVGVPASPEGEVFIAGFFPGTGLPPWVPYSILLQPDGGRFTVTVDLPAGTEMQYVYTRGDFGRIERPATCGNTPPRKVVVGSAPMTLLDDVVKWHDLDCS